jgi:hypothetical protein
LGVTEKSGVDGKEELDMVHAHSLSYSSGGDQGRQQNFKFKVSLGKVIQTLTQKQNANKRAGA